jgi:hypothetical protein
MEPSKKNTALNRIFSIWPFVRLGLEALSLVVLFFHLIPDKIEEHLKDTCIGVFIILGVLVIFALTHSIQLTFLLSSKESIYSDNIAKKDIELDKKAEANNLLGHQMEDAKKTINQLTNYKNLFVLNNKTFASLRDAHRADLLSGDKNELKLALREFCNDVNEIFSNLKSTKNITFHVCIKVMTQPGNQNLKAKQILKADKIKVKTLMRDGRGDGTRSKIDTIKIDHYVSDNTDFLAIFEQVNELQNRCFMCNDLSFDGYRNSSFKKFNRDKLPYYIKGTKWPLSYTASITAPICPGITPPDVKSGTLIGFLCVDSTVSGLFNDSDIEIVSGLAEGLYDTLNHYINKYVLKLS